MLLQIESKELWDLLHISSRSKGRTVHRNKFKGTVGSKRKLVPADYAPCVLLIQHDSYIQWTENGKQGTPKKGCRMTNQKTSYGTTEKSVYVRNNNDEDA